VVLFRRAPVRNVLRGGDMEVHLGFRADLADLADRDREKSSDFDLI
jgi:hypothetical protein